MADVAAIPLIPDLAALCIEVMTGPGEFCITFPGGATLCAGLSIERGDASEILKGLLMQINGALLPLVPFFNVLDVVKAVGDCIQAIPDCIGPTPTPEPILKCIPKLVQSLEKLLQLLPQYTIPVLIKGILNVIIASLIALRQKLSAMLKQVARIAAAAVKAATLGGGIGLELQAAIDCAQSNLDAQLENENASLMPLNRLIGLLNVLLKLAGLPCVPTLGGLGALTEDVLLPLDAAIRLLQQIAAAIPADLSLPVVPGPDEPC